MSTIKVTNLQDTSGGNQSTSGEIFQGRAKAWINFNGNGTVPTILEMTTTSVLSLIMERDYFQLIGDNTNSFPFSSSDYSAIGMLSLWYVSARK